MKAWIETAAKMGEGRRRLRELVLETVNTEARQLPPVLLVYLLIWRQGQVAIRVEKAKGL